MRTPTELEIQQLMHVYDPVKAHEYYIKNRKLKGRKKGKGVELVRSRPAAKKDLSRDVAFLKSLPLAQEGKPLPQVARFVKSLQSKSNDQLRVEIRKFKVADAKSANPSPLGGLEAMTAERVLRARGVDPRKGKTRVQISKDARTRQRKELSASIAKLEDRLKKLEAKIAQMKRDESSENRKSKAKKERAAKEKDKPKTAAEKAEIARENKKYREKNQQKLKTDAKNRDDSGGGSKTKKGSSSGPAVSDLQALATRVRGQIAVAKQKLAAL